MDDVYRLILSTSMSGIIWGANTVVVSLYLLSLHYSPLFIGVLFTLSILVSSVEGFIFSILGDLYGRKKFALLSRGLSAVFIFLFYLKFVYAYIFMVGWGSGSLISAIIADKAKNLERVYSYQTSLNILFSVLGSSLPLFLSYSQIFLLEFVVSLISFSLLFTVREDYKGKIKLINLINVIKLSSLPTISKFLPEALIGFGAGLILPLMSLWFRLRFYVTASDISPVFMSSQLTLALAVIYSSKLSEKLGMVKTIVYTHVVATLLLFVLPFSPTFFVASVIYVLRNALMNMASPVLVMSLIPRDERSRASSLIQLIDSLPRAFAPSLGGYLFNKGNLVLPFLITGALYFTSTIVFYSLFRNVKR
ncbi:MFS transporter [Stygiolobus azoricus]|uniref:MFS transporter n=1 Tax=Stygiolobus azoricus TaxID=41675 RepID=A0A650CPY5_9CREN|nr:MFS transporter [Stygiolobus azoricus]QGR19712.1 MFS transporter [Stygiolobus azoricus]